MGTAEWKASRTRRWYVGRGGQDGLLGPFRLGLGCLGLKLCGVSHLRVTALGAWPWPQGGSAGSEGGPVSIWGPSGSSAAPCRH